MHALADLGKDSVAFWECRIVDGQVLAFVGAPGMSSWQAEREAGSRGSKSLRPAALPWGPRVTRPKEERHRLQSENDKLRAVVLLFLASVGRSIGLLVVSSVIEPYAAIIWENPEILWILRTMEVHAWWNRGQRWASTFDFKPKTSPRTIVQAALARLPGSPASGEVHPGA